MGRAVKGRWSDSAYVIVDVEGNGAQPPEIVELAYAVVESGKAGPSGDWLIRPVAPVTPIVQRIHGIGNEELATAPPLEAVAHDITVALGERVLVAHSAAVERDILRRQLPSWRPPAIIDTQRLAKRAWPELGKYSLATLRQTLTLGGTSHRALGDAVATRQLLFAAIEKLEQAQGPMSFDELVRAAGGDQSANRDDQMSLGL